MLWKQKFTWYFDKPTLQSQVNFHIDFDIINYLYNYC